MGTTGLFLGFFRRFLMSLLGMLESLFRMLHGLAGELVSAQVISFSMVRRGCPMGLSG
jgi:hypothetical protein